jgi:hypothetical protein
MVAQCKANHEMVDAALRTIKKNHAPSKRVLEKGLNV